MGKKTNKQKLREHVKTVCGIDLETRLTISRPNTMKDFALVGPLVVLYHYAGYFEEKIHIQDMVASGHKSHLLGSELDFDSEGNEKDLDPIIHIKMAADLLQLKDKMQDRLDSFRLGVYFDRFDTAKAKTFEEFEKTYAKQKSAATMHLGVRYKWTHKDYKAGPVLMKFGWWGKGSEHFGKGGLWEKRVKSWNIGYLDSAALDAIAADVLKHFALLNASPPSGKTKSPAKPPSSSPVKPKTGMPDEPKSGKPGETSGTLGKRVGQRGVDGRQRGPLGTLNNEG